MDWYTSDQHFGHANIIKYCSRPFVSAEQMDEFMITRWNAKVGHEDHVFVVGDFSFLGIVPTTEILRRLRGTKHLILGNHDDHRTPTFWRRAGFATVRQSMTLEVAGYEQVVVQHRPMWFSKADMTHTALCVHGHVHERYLAKHYKSTGFTTVNVGVDKWSFEPVSLNEIVEVARRVQLTKEGLL
jgi:calcineurin-like phosphoesterase family protein